MTRFARLAAAGAGLVAASACVSAPNDMAQNAMNQGGDCDRACLAEALDAYLGAVVADDPAQAPLFVAFRQTENAVVVPLGEGVWDSVTGVGGLDRRYYDPVLSSAVFFGVLEEGDDAAVAALRIKVVDDVITEAEWNIGRRDDPGIDGAPGEVLFDADGLVESGGPPDRVVPEDERVSRAALAAIANSYFDTITNANRDIAFVHPGCTRRENGLLVTGRPLSEDRMWDGHEGRGDCVSGQGAFNVTLVAARRLAAVDVEAQVAIYSAVFLREPGNYKRRNAFTEVFAIDGGRIRDVYAAMYYVDPDRAVPDWPPYDGNYPLPESYGPVE